MKTLFLGSASLLTSVALTLANTQVVTNHNDKGAGSLRAAIANGASGDTITFDLPTPNAITLSTSELLIDKNLTITGPGADQLTVTRSTAGGTSSFPVFHISAGNFAVSISGLTLSNGNNAGVSGSGRGGGLDNESSGIVDISACTFSDNMAYNEGGGLCQNGSGILNLTDCIISGNATVTGFGGGLAAENSDSSVTLLRCTISSNTAGYSGAGVYSFSGSTMTITESTISDNFLTASPGVGDGGGIFNTGRLTLVRCTIANNSNQRGSGGGIQNQGQLIADNSTFFGNTAQFNGGAISNDAPAIITNCTITENTALQTSSYGIVDGGGGISSYANFFATAMLKNTIVADNQSPTNPDVAGLSGAITSSGFNLIGDGTGGEITSTTGDRIGTEDEPIDPMLEPLAENGGPTQTCALLPGSPAIDIGDPGAPATDQRNYNRTTAPDIGAFELGATIPQTLANISTRLLVETGDNVLIGGFIVTGTHAKPVLLRAIGPSLALDGKLADPALELHDSSGAIIATNDDWQTNDNKAEIIATGLAPTKPEESALLMTLDPGAYTAIVHGASNGSGIALVEAYDLDQTSDTKLANISTRGFVQTGGNVMIGGFIILGNLEETVLIRGIGPSLPLAGSLADPTLELHDADGATIASNDNWRDSQEAEIEATGIPPTDDAESATLATLAPGGYTAILRGAGDTTGVALVEVYGLY